MKRLISILLITLLPTILMAEEVLMKCDRDNSLRINLGTNMVQFAKWPPIEIYWSNSNYIMWIGNALTTKSKWVTMFVLDRLNGELHGSSMDVNDPSFNSLPTIDQCFRSF